MDVANPRHRNIVKKEAKKILKYRKLATEIQLMWNVKTQVIPVTIQAAGTIAKTFRKYLSNVTEKHKFEELQKTAVLGTGYVSPKVLP